MFQTQINNVAVTVIPGKEIRLARNGQEHVYPVGGEAVYDSWNLAYIGKIVSITAKSVTISTHPNDPKKRLDFEKFVNRNKFGIASAKKQNAEWMD